jgi:hypothetical protein
MNSETVFVVLFHISNLMAFLAFLLRDQLHLRLLMAVSLALQALYYYAIPAGPLFDPLFWKVVSLIANVAMIVLVFGGRLDFGIPSDLRGLYDRISVLSPGQFRKLAKHSTRTLPQGTALLVEGRKPDKLHYLLKGEAELTKSGNSHTLQPGIFLGEVAFLSNATASATITLRDGAECVSWEVEQLKALMKKDRAIDIAIRGLFNSDLAAKVAKSLPQSLQ